MDEPSVETRFIASPTYDAALRLLSRREHARLELKQKLARKQFSDSDIDSVLNQLAKENLQSDARFAEAYVRYRKQAGFGPFRIAGELRERGISQALIEGVVDKNSEEWEILRQQVLEKKFSALDRASKDPRKKQQQERFLFYRGFE